MSAWTVVALLGAVAVALLCARLPTRARWLAPVLQTLVAVGIALAVLAQLPTHAVAANLAVPGLGRLALTRLTAAVLVGSWAAALLEMGSAARRQPSGAAAAVQILVGVGCSAVLALTGLLPLSLVLAAVMLVVWLRWQRLAGPVLPIRSLARQAAIVLCALLAAVALLPAQRIGAAPPALLAMLLVGGLGGVSGLLPLSAWVGAVTRMGPAEGSLWRVWLLPLGVVTLARVVVPAPHHLAQVLQLLLVALGLASAIFWSGAAINAAPGSRYHRVLAADVGFMCVGIGSGDLIGFAGALLLVLVHWLAGAALSEPQAARSHLLAWVGVSGVPPFGGFSGRLLVLVGSSFMGPLVLSGVVLAFGLQLVACGLGIGEAVRRGSVRGPALSELLGLGAAVATLAMGIFAQPLLRFAFGISL